MKLTPEQQAFAKSAVRVARIVSDAARIEYEPKDWDFEISREGVHSAVVLATHITRSLEERRVVATWRADGRFQMGATERTLLDVGTSAWGAKALTERADEFDHAPRLLRALANAELTTPPLTDFWAVVGDGETSDPFHDVATLAGIEWVLENGTRP